MNTRKFQIAEKRKVSENKNNVIEKRSRKTVAKNGVAS